MENWLLSIINEYGYIGIFALIALENIFPPIPSEVILTFSGFVTTSTHLSIFGVVISSTLGSITGAVGLYGVGLLLDVERMEKIVDKWGKVLRLTRKDIHKADSWFDKYGPWTVFLCRFVPLIRSLISIPAGMSNMNFTAFFVLTTLGTLIWNTVLIWIGASVGDSWHSILTYMDIYSSVVYIILAVAVVAAVYWYFKKIRNR
ncbi:DedA family protein [Halobacillus shinanisalinarum]|uniref:DedA family protein n=1 Tax=Halobacillus shinanisalinarum TaxID=2932258 RepID=A0ABY4H6P9_9BACI|nr:DedA family protein [Halobacillus shinanisalinarum]UOQ95774.1 DedA family protein [Halobacillus shinanisalinarum]